MIHNLYTALDKGLISSDQDRIKIFVDSDSLSYLHVRNIVHREYIET